MKGMKAKSSFLVLLDTGDVAVTPCVEVAGVPRVRTRPGRGVLRERPPCYGEVSSVSVH